MNTTTVDEPSQPSPPSKTNKRAPEESERPEGKRKRSCKRWTEEENRKLIEACAKWNAKNWTEISKYVGNGKTSDQCNQHWHRVLNPNISKKPWTQEEDQLLLAKIQEFGVSSWKKISKDLVGRTDLQCRHRWTQITKSNNISIAKINTEVRTVSSTPPDVSELDEHSFRHNELQFTIDGPRMRLQQRDRNPQRQYTTYMTTASGVMMPYDIDPMAEIQFDSNGPVEQGSLRNPLMHEISSELFGDFGSNSTITSPQQLHTSTDVRYHGNESGNIVLVNNNNSNNCTSSTEAGEIFGGNGFRGSITFDQPIPSESRADMRSNRRSFMLNVPYGQFRISDQGTLDNSPIPVNPSLLIVNGTTQSMRDSNNIPSQPQPVSWLSNEEDYSSPFQQQPHPEHSLESSPYKGKGSTSFAHSDIQPFPVVANGSANHSYLSFCDSVVPTEGGYMQSQQSLRLQLNTNQLVVDHGCNLDDGHPIHQRQHSTLSGNIGRQGDVGTSGTIHTATISSDGMQAANLPMANQTFPCQQSNQQSTSLGNTTDVISPGISLLDGLDLNHNTNMSLFPQLSGYSSPVEYDSILSSGSDPATNTLIVGTAPSSMSYPTESEYPSSSSNSSSSSSNTNSISMNSPLLHNHVQQLQQLQHLHQIHHQQSQHFRQLQMQMQVQLQNSHLQQPSEVPRMRAYGESGYLKPTIVGVGGGASFTIGSLTDPLQPALQGTPSQRHYQL